MKVIYRLSHECRGNNTQPNKEIRQCKRNDKRFGFGLKPPSAANMEDNKSISADKFMEI